MEKTNSFKIEKHKEEGGTVVLLIVAYLNGKQKMCSTLRCTDRKEASQCKELLEEVYAQGFAAGQFDIV